MIEDRADYIQRTKRNKAKIFFRFFVTKTFFFQEIDEYLNQAKEKGYSAVLQLGSKGVNYATNVIMQTALKV